MKSNANYDVIIIGAGPGGISAAIYFKRAGINPLIIEADAPGGTLNKTHKIENYPGYVDKDGTTLAFRMYSQIEELGVELKSEKVINIEKMTSRYEVKTNSNSYFSNYVLIATGKIPRKLKAINAEKFEGKGISYCTICDGALYKNKDIAIIGGGNSAMEAVSYMKDIANNIYVINRSLNLRADEEEKKVINNSNVKVIYGANVVEIIGKDEVEKIKLDNGDSLDVNAVFICIGQDSNLAYYQNLNLKSYALGIIVDKDMKTSDDNVYACGDAISKDLYQVVTATSEGAIAATNIIKKIRKSNN